jgi:uncharacterized membrane protein
MSTLSVEGTLFLLLLALTGLNLLGVAALGIGVLVTIPVGALALIHAYRTLASPGLTARPE